jgi:hypothetical protein
VTGSKPGPPLISYWDFTNLELKVAHCEDLVCGVSTTSTLDSSGNVGGHSSIAIGVDGLGLISYYNGSDNLEVMHCGNRFCMPFVRHRWGRRRLHLEGSSVSVPVERGAP